MDDKDKPLRLFVLIFGRLLLIQVAVLACVASKYLILCMTALICGVAGMKTLLAMGPTSVRGGLVTAFASRLFSFPVWRRCLGVWPLEDLIDPILVLPFAFMRNAVVLLHPSPHQRCLCWSITAYTTFFFKIRNWLTFLRKPVMLSYMLRLIA